MRSIRAALLLSVAIAVALTSGAYAVQQITGAQIKNGSVTGKDVKNKSLTRTDFRGSVRGPRGFRGAQGPQGLPGSAGIASITAVSGPVVTVAPSTVGSTTATCPAGSVVVGTGFDASIGNVGFVERFGNFVVGMGVVNDTTIDIDIQAQAICASGPGVSGASAARSASTARSRFERKVAALRATR